LTIEVIGHVGFPHAVCRVLQGCWFLAIAHILLSNDTMWAVSHARDMTPVMFTPVLFAWIAIGGLCMAMPARV
jgi:hypothetical protein